MFKFFLDDSDDKSIDTFINEKGDFDFGMKLDKNMGINLDGGTPYFKVGDNFGIDI